MHSPHPFLIIPYNIGPEKSGLILLETNLGFSVDVPRIFGWSWIRRAIYVLSWSSWLIELVLINMHSPHPFLIIPYNIRPDISGLILLETNLGFSVDVLGFSVDVPRIFGWSWIRRASYVLSWSSWLIKLVLINIHTPHCVLIIPYNIRPDISGLILLETNLGFSVDVPRIFGWSWLRRASYAMSWSSWLIELVLINMHSPHPFLIIPYNIRPDISGLILLETNLGFSVDVPRIFGWCSSDFRLIMNTSC